MARRRLDAELVRRGLVATRTEAQEAVRSGLVLVGGSPASRPSSLVAPGDAVHLQAPARRFVSRGGEKLAAALDRFGIRADGRSCLDAGASTGGFTECLLQRGAVRVAAVDVGYGQLAWRLRNDPRVTVLERTNVRRLSPEDIPFVPDLVTADVSFISLRVVVPALARLAVLGADFVLLVKPQFEAGARAVGKGGVVRDPGVWRESIAHVAEAGRALGLAPRAAMASPLLGPAGNVEFPLHLVLGGEETPFDLDEAIAEGLAVKGEA